MGILVKGGYAEATTEAAAGASKNARELYNQIYESKRQAALDRMMQESQFRRQMRAQGGDKAVAAIPAVIDGLARAIKSLAGA